MRDEMHVAVQTIQPMHDAHERGEETPVEALLPVRRHNGVRGSVRGDAMGEVIYFGVGDVPPLSHG